MDLYKKRNHEALGSLYLRHIDAMTTEGLHSKSSIAGELAARDAEIERLRAVADQSRSALEKTMGAFWGTCSWHADVKKAIAAIDAALDEEVKGGE